MPILGRRLLFAPAAAALLLTVLSFLYLLSPAHPRQPLAVLGQEASLASDIPIPRQIWQIFFPPPGATVLEKSVFWSASWISMAPGYTYTLVSDAEAASLISTHFSHRPEIGATYHALTNPALKSDLLRYLILAVRGGVYSDIDTKPLVPLESWLSPALGASAPRLVVALEFDATRDAQTDQTVHPVQFCQWTIAAAPGHPVLTRMVDRALRGLGAAADALGADIAHAVLADKAVLNATGPVAWSENLLDVLRERDPRVAGFRDFAGLREPRVFGDIVVMPIDSFRGDWADDWGTWINYWRKGRRALVRHYFKGTWRINKLPGQV